MPRLFRPNAETALLRMDMSRFTQGGVARRALRSCSSADMLGSSAAMVQESWKCAPGRYAAMALDFGTQVLAGMAFIRSDVENHRTQSGNKSPND